VRLKLVKELSQQCLEESSGM